MWFVLWYRGYNDCRRYFNTAEEAYAYFCWIDGVDGIRSPIWGKEIP